MSLAKFFIDNYKFTLILTFGLVVYGLSSLINLKTETFPNVNIGAVIVTTVYPGASGDDIETKITKPLEDEIRGVRGLKEVRSVSQPNVSTINVIIDIDRYPVKEVVADLQRAVDRTSDLPSDLEDPPRFFEVKSDEFPVNEIAVVGSNEGRKRDLVADELKEHLEDIKSISSITLTGFKDRQFNINLHKDKLIQKHVSLNEVTRALRAQNVNIPGGNLETQGTQSIVKIEGKAKSTKELEQLVVRSNFSGERVLLGDISTIEDGEEDPTTLTSYESEAATFLTIAKKGGSDITELTELIEPELERFREKYKDQFQFIVYSDEGVRVGNRVSVLSSSGLIGFALVVIFLFIFLPGMVGAMTAVSLPLALMGTIGFMQSMGYTLNTITISALVISLGMLVDNAVVISENFTRLKEEGQETIQALLETISDLWLPISATAMTTIAAFLPMLVTKGVMGQFIIGIPVVVSLALLLSLFEGFFLLPTRLMWASRFIKKPLSDGKKNVDWFSRDIAPRFENLLDWLVTHRYISALIFSGLILSSLFMMGVVNKFILFPAGQTEIYLTRVELPNNAKLEVTQEKLNAVTKAIQEKFGDNLAHVITKAGISQKDFNDPRSRLGDNVGMVMTYMTREATNSLNTNSVLDDLREIKVENTRLIHEAFINGPPIGAPVTAIFRSNNETQTEEVAQKVVEHLKSIEGIFDVEIDDIFGPEEIYVEVDQSQANRLNLNLATIGSSVRTAVAGEILNDVNLNNEDVNYFLRFSKEDRASTEDLSRIQISDPAGNFIPLSNVAEVVKKDGSPQIKRFDFKRAKTVTANIDDDVITSVVANQKLKTYFDSISKDYPEVSLKFGGEAERTQESMESLFQALILSLLGIFGLLVFMFKSYIRPIIILTTIPLGLVGVAFSFFLHGRPISFLALIGIVGLGGIIVNSGIVLISFIEKLRESDHGDLKAVLVKASSLRLRAVVVTSLTTVCGLLPTAYGIGGSDEFIIPMTLAMAWGLVSGTILALLWVPCAYAITEDLSHFTNRLFKRV